MLPSDIEFWLVDSPSDISDFVAWLTDVLDRRTLLAVDTETTGLDWWTPNFCRLVQFGTATQGWAVPVGWHPRLLTWAFERIVAAGQPVVFHNAKFDMHALQSAGLPALSWRQVQDTMVLHHLLHPHHRHGLKPITERLFGSWCGIGQRVLAEHMKVRRYDWATVPVDDPWYWGYGVVDTILTARLYPVLLAEGPPLDAYEREMAYSAIMYRAERRGLRLDLDYCRDLRSEWAVEMSNLALQLKQAGIENPNSNKQVEAALREMGWEPDAFTATGQAQVDSLVLERLRSLPGPQAAVAEQLVDFKRKSKWTSTYLDHFLGTGLDRAYPTVRTLGAKTGRSSITSPPLQTLPHTPHIRRAVLPEDGHDLYTIDYSGQEYRILTSFSGDEAWTNEFLHGAGDPHTMVAEMLGITRPQAKTFNFAMVYGAGPKKLALGTGLSVPQVERFLATYSQRFPGIAKFINDTQREGYRQARDGQEPHVVTAGGRTVYADADQLYALTNYRIQGSGADVLKEAAVRLDKSGLSDYIMLPVHDELIFSFPKGESAVLSAEAADIMTNRDWFSIPIIAEPSGPFSNWGRPYE